MKTIANNILKIDISYRESLIDGNAEKLKFFFHKNMKYVDYTFKDESKIRVINRDFYSAEEI